MKDFFTEKDRPSASAVEVYNNTGSTMEMGTLVYVNGFSTNNYCPTVGLADGTDATKPAQLVLRDKLLSAQKGWADTVALITKPSTAGRTVGDTCYLSVTSAGGIQWTAPTAAGHQVQPVGVCVAVASTGTVYFTPGISFETQLGSTGIPDASITNAKLAATAVTESKTVAKTLTKASLSDTAGILGSQLSATAGIAGTQLGAGTLHQVKTSIGHANATPTIVALPAGALLCDVWTVCTATYDATAPTIDIGYSGAASAILPTASIGKTVTNVSGDDPAVRGTDLYVPGAQSSTAGDWTVTQGTLSGGDWTYTPGTLTPDDWTVTDFTQGAEIQTKTAASLGAGSQTKTNMSLSAGSQTKTASNWAVSTFGHPRKKFYATATTVIATIAGASGNTTGTMDVYLSYLQTVP